MRKLLASYLRKAALKRSFLCSNPDIRTVFARKRRVPRATGAASLSPDQLAHWNDRGFLVLPGFFSDAAVEAYRRHIDELWSSRTRADNPLVFFNAAGGRRFRDVADEDRQAPYRLLDHYLTDARTRDLAMDPRLMAMLHELMGHAPVVCNSLLFEFGSQQDMHSDMFYMAPLSDNQMLATWIALDDVGEDNGPLVYVPGSHKMPPHRFSHGKVNAITAEVPGAVAAIQQRMEALGLRPEKFLARRGDVLIWHSQLMHGGAAIRDPSARRTSVVTHYFSALDFPAGPFLCGAREDGSLLLLKEHVPLAPSAEPSAHDHD